MKTNKNTLVVVILTILSFGISASAVDLEFYGGVYAEIDTTVDGSVWIYDATVAMYEPAHITEFVIATSGATLNIYGGQIDYMLMVTTSENEFPEAAVTVYGTDFMVDGVPVEPGTPELFLSGQILSGIYETGTPFSFMVDCILMGNAGSVFYQTVKLGWVSSAPVIELEQTEYDFGQTEVGTIREGTVTVTNVGDAALNIQDVGVFQEGLLQFDIEPLQVIPLTLEPGGSLTLTVYYSPFDEGLAEGTLGILSDDPVTPYVEVALYGEGIPASPEQQIIAILDFYHWAIENGTLEGEGNNRSAANKLETFGEMLGIAEELILAGQYNQAMGMLTMVEAKCDGQRSPVDFVIGEAAPLLNAMINDLIDTLQDQCNPFYGNRLHKGRLHHITNNMVGNLMDFLHRGRAALNTNAHRGKSLQR